MTERLAKLGIELVQDLLFHLPLRYQDRTQIYPIGSLTEGQAVLIEGEVEHSEIVMRKRRMLLCQLSDGTGHITLRFFHFSNAQYMSMTKGKTIRCFGEIRYGPQSLEIIHPEYKLISATNTIEVEDTLTPTYPTTEGLQQRSFRRLIGLALDNIEELEELIPLEIQQKYQLADIEIALKTLHHPPPNTHVNKLLSGRHPAQKYLIFEEMMAHHISLRKLREQAKQLPGLAINNKGTLYKKLLKQLPFTLTKAQQRVIKELRKDLQQGYPMNRLVQGDVGSGKTLVAAAAALYAIESGFQVALMAPTEILAEQHHHNFKQWLKPLELEVSWIGGKQTARERRSEVENLLLGITHIAIGTHALFQANVQFNQLGLVIIDEQHRFGVDQRLALREKGKQADYYPHQLIMTATPIPRTLAMTACADLDYSVVDELPPGRQAIKTVALPNDRRDEIIQRINHICSEGNQVYWVCTLIEESEVLQCQNVEETCELLIKSLPELNIDLVHGRMKSEQKDLVMSLFKQSKIDILVATTVIEVGVDVPNASLMVIENAERLGLAQLHQLRGRVGRGTTASSCVLLYQPPLSKNSFRRINALRKNNDGFEIARIDLEIRGPGEVFGTRQTGELNFRIANLARDQVYLPDVQQAAHEVMMKSPEVGEKLIKRWINQTEDYSKA